MGSASAPAVFPTAQRRCVCRICSSRPVLPPCWPASPSCFSSSSSPGAGPRAGGSPRGPGLCPCSATCCSSISADLSKHSARWIRRLPKEHALGVEKKNKTKSEFFAILVVQEIWACVHRALRTQESGGAGQPQDRQGGSGREGGRVRGQRHLPDLPGYQPRSRYVRLSAGELGHLSSSRCLFMFL